MLHAANLCIRRDPHLRPRMSHVSHSPLSFFWKLSFSAIITDLVGILILAGSLSCSRLVSFGMFLKVLRILEGGDMVVDSGSDAGSRSWRLQNERCQEQSSPAQRDSQSQTAGSPWSRDRQNLSHRY